MKKQEILSKLKEKTRMSTFENEKVLNALKDIIYEALENGEKVQFLGFGTFDTKDTKERIWRNPKTNEDKVIPSSKKPYLKPGKEFKDRVQKINK